MGAGPIGGAAASAVGTAGAGSWYLNCGAYARAEVCSGGRGCLGTCGAACGRIGYSRFSRLLFPGAMAAVLRRRRGCPEHSAG